MPLTSKIWCSHLFVVALIIINQREKKVLILLSLVELLNNLQPTNKQTSALFAN